MDSFIGKKVQYNKHQIATVLEENKTHFLVQFESGVKVTTQKAGLEIVN